MDEKTVQSWQEDLNFLKQLIDLMRQKYEELAMRAEDLLRKQNDTHSIEEATRALNESKQFLEGLKTSQNATMNEVGKSIEAIAGQMNSTSQELKQLKDQMSRQDQMEKDIQQILTLLSDPPDAPQSTKLQQAEEQCALEDIRNLLESISARLDKLEKPADSAQAPGPVAQAPDKPNSSISGGGSNATPTSGSKPAASSPAPGMKPQNGITPFSATKNKS